MTTIDQHIFREWLKMFGLAVSATLGILLLEDIYDNLQDLLGNGASWGEVAKYYLVSTPASLPAVLPLSLMISILFSLGSLHRNNEIIALRACGLSLMRITRSLWFAGILFSGILFYLNAHLVPWSIEESRKMSERFEYSHQLLQKGVDEVGLIYNLTFYNRREKRLWFMNRFSKLTYRGYGLTVSLMNGEGDEKTRYVAREAYFDDLDGNWVFLRGREITFDAPTSDPIRSLPFSEKILSQFKEDPSLMESLEKRPKDLSLFELARILEEFSTGEDPRWKVYAVRYNGILANPFSALIVVGLAIPFAVTGVRINPMIGASQSIILFFAYYLVENTAALLGERGIIDPVSAAWLPNAVMLVLAGWLYRRAD